MNELHFRRLSAGTRIGHLVSAGEAIGLTEDGEHRITGADVVVTSVLRDGTGWRVTYHEIHPRRPAA